MDPPEVALRATLRTPRAAGIAGIVFSLLLATTLVLIRLAAPSGGAKASRGSPITGTQRSVVIALNLVPFAGIAFLWFIGVIRDKVGDREDRFFATVFLGSGSAVRRDAVRRSRDRRRSARRSGGSAGRCLFATCGISSSGSYPR